MGSLGGRVRRLEGDAAGREPCEECENVLPGEPVEYDVEWDDHGTHGEPEFCSGCGRQLVFIVTWPDVPEEPPHGKEDDS